MTIFQNAKPNSPSQEKAKEISTKHISLPYHPRNVPNDSLNGNLSADAPDIHKRRLVYLAKQRGWLEVDLLLGTWASDNVGNLALEELDDFQAFETINIYNVIRFRIDVLEEM